MSDKTRIENNAFKHSDINEDDSDIAMAKFESFIEGAKSRDQELASLREQLEKEQEISQRLSDDLASALDTIEQKEDENRELLKTIEYGELELRTTYERHTNYKGSSSLWKMQEILKKYGGKNLSA